MKHRYYVSGIKQSYRYTSESRTVVMPILITLLLAAMAAFYFYGKPNTESKTVTGEIGATSEFTGIHPDNARVPPTSPIPGSTPELVTTESKLEPDTVTTDIASLPTPDVDMGNFTPWMSPDDLDAWVKKRNEGHSISFWRRGHWITAVEGRWNGKDHEFRIAFDKTPPLQDWRWQYRVNQTPEEFMQNSNTLQEQGYRMVQVQSFDHPDKRRRYQAVWEKTNQLGSTVAAHKDTPSTELPPAVPTTAVAATSVAATSVAATSMTTSTGTTDSAIATPPNSSASPTGPIATPKVLNEDIAEDPRDEAPRFETNALDVNNLQFR